MILGDVSSDAFTSSAKDICDELDDVLDDVLVALRKTSSVWCLEISLHCYCNFRPKGFWGFKDLGTFGELIDIELLSLLPEVFISLLWDVFRAFSFECGDLFLGPTASWAFAAGAASDAAILAFKLFTSHFLIMISFFTLAFFNSAFLFTCISNPYFSRPF